MAPLLHIDGTSFRDDNRREVTLHGINLAGDSKLPRRPDQPSHEPLDFLDADGVSFVDRPFELSEAPKHFTRLRQWGYNTLRYLFTWEAIEHAGPGKYDESFLDFTISVLRVAKEYGFYVIMDPHQDVWSRFTGGSGAPLWTVYACGLDPHKFGATEAALVQNLWPDPLTFPKMIWATNYTRLACQTIFTLFFAGEPFAPKAKINGVNIQHFLQGHFVGACKLLATKVKEAGDLEGSCVIGWESVNEPNRGLVGVQDITEIPSEQRLQKGTSPTAWQAMLLGSGRPQKITSWEFGNFGPYKSGTEYVNPHGKSAWVQDTHYDEKYGLKRDPSWQLGKCLWAQHGVWNTNTNEVMKKDYFARDPYRDDIISYEYFTNVYFMSYYRRYRDAIRSVFPNTFMFCQPPVLEIPPSLKGTDDDDPNMVYAPHWYDGVTLMNKKWNKYWNVDVFGVLRGRYLTPGFALKFGENNIRNCFRDQLSAMRKEGLDFMGLHPCVFTEFGIPHDMDDGRAFKTGNYKSQVAAMDANHFAVEGSKVGFCLWNYTLSNCHKWGDQWNGEDLSIVSEDDPLPPRSGPIITDPLSPYYSDAQTAASSDTLPPVNDAKRVMSASVSDRYPSPVESSDSDNHYWYPRAAYAFIRPAPISTHGSIVSYGFDLKKMTFSMDVLASRTAAKDTPTEVFLPQLHFPQDLFDVDVSAGHFELAIEQVGSEGRRQILRWWNEDGQQQLKVKAKGLASETDGWFMDRCGESRCQAM